MKSRLTLGALAFLAVLFWAATIFALSTGCSATGGGSVVTPERVQSVTKLAVYITAKRIQAENPAAESSLRKALTGFDELVAAETWDIQTAAGIAAANGLDILSGPEGQVAMVAVPIFIDLFTRETIDLNRSPHVRAVIIGCQEGLRLALGVKSKIGFDALLDKLKKDAVATRPPR